MLKPNYCEPCKYQFRDFKSLQAHINTTHPTGPKSTDPSPVSTKILMPEDQMYFYLQNSKISRDNCGVYKDKDTSELCIENHEKFMRLEHTLKEQVNYCVKKSLHHK